MRPLDGLVTTRTGSRCSRVGPAVTTTLFPCHGARCNRDRKSTRLNSSHGYISYAVFCLKKKKNIQRTPVGKRHTTHRQQVPINPTTQLTRRDVHGPDRHSLVLIRPPAQQHASAKPRRS